MNKLIPSPAGKSLTGSASANAAPQNQPYIDLAAPITDAELEQAHTVLAEVVATCGEAYLPLFSIVDAEIKRRAEQRARATAIFEQNELKRRRSLRRKSRRVLVERDAQSL